MPDETKINLSPTDDIVNKRNLWKPVAKSDYPNSEYISWISELYHNFTLSVICFCLQISMQGTEFTKRLLLAYFINVFYLQLTSKNFIILIHRKRPAPTVLAAFRTFSNNPTIHLQTTVFTTHKQLLINAFLPVTFARNLEHIHVFKYYATIKNY